MHSEMVREGWKVIWVQERKEEDALERDEDREAPWQCTSCKAKVGGWLG